MKLNTDKCLLIVSGYKHEQVWRNIGKDFIWESNDVNFLGVTIDVLNLYMFLKFAAKPTKN